MRRSRAIPIWTAVAAAILLALGLAAASPLLAWRSPVYIAAGLAGVAGMALLAVQALLAGGQVPGIGPGRWRRAHRLVGGGLVLLILAHVGGLWLTSPPDMVDALLFASPTPFSAWGVVAMWALLATAALALMRRRMMRRLRQWRWGHKALAAVIASASVGHAMLIDGTMEPLSKALLSALVLAATGMAIWRGR